MAKMPDPELREALVGRGRGGRPAAAGHPGRCRWQPQAGLIIQGVNRQADLQRVRRAHASATSPRSRASTPSRSMLDLSLAGRPERRVPRPGQGLQRRVHGRDDQRLAVPIPGVSDGGAHTKFFTGGACTTDFLRWLVRDEEVVTLEEAHYRLSALAAHAAGFQDRGTLREGAAADVVVYDMEELDIEPHVDRRGRPRPARWRVAPGAAGQGLPAHHRQRRGHVRDGECTGATPGRLLRHGRG